MNFTEALDILRKGNGLGATENEAVEAIKTEIAMNNGIDLQLILATLGNELQHSKNPSFSYQILWTILGSEDEKIEGNFGLRILFVREALGSESVRDGALKCMAALGACTQVIGD